MSIMTILAHISSISVPLTAVINALIAAAVFFSIIDAPKPNSSGASGDTVNLEADIGKKTAIVGPSGSGKSTLIALIERWYELSEADPVANFLRNGTVKIGPTELKIIDLFWWRAQIGIVQQDLFLFDDTVFNNIAFGLIGTAWESASAKVKERLVIQACKEAYAHEFIGLLPKVCTGVQ
jgi:ATP-binding cassette subfamily B (MDR/TAP) protein 1